MTGKLYALAQLAALLVAIVGAFTVIPYGVAILLVLGAIGGLGVAKEDRTRLYVIAVLLTVASASLQAIPAAGVYLSSIFGGLAAAYVGASILALTIGLVCSIRNGLLNSDT